MDKKIKPAVLVILDGWGISPQKEGNATLAANIPFFKELVENYPSCLLSASSEAVGLTPGEPGNSEVGHLNLGAGRIVWQDLARISRSIREKTFLENPKLLELINYVKQNNKKLHLIGLVSDGGVHSHIDHLIALLELAKIHQLKSVYLHIISDGRDTAPKHIKVFLTKLIKPMAASGAKIATVSGRFYAMDRDKHWERIKPVYDALFSGKGRLAENVDQAIDLAYQNQESDEFITPTVICDKEQKPTGLIENTDGIIFFNFRADRARQLTSAMIEKNFKFFKRQPVAENLKIVTMSRYEENKDWPVGVVFTPINFKNILAEVISDQNLKQLHVAETEKYAHVTYFFNGGREEPFVGEDRILVPSPRVATYDLKPEMSADQIKNKVIQNLAKYDFMVINFANPDMVGHTGNLKAAVRALESLDICLKELIGQTLKLKIPAVITADHGNVEQLINSDTGQIDKEHTTNPVPFILVDQNNKLAQKKDLAAFLNQPPIGVLADVAPTILDIMNLAKVNQMTGQSLLGSL